MKTNCQKAKHSRFCTMGVSPTATSGGRENGRSYLHFYSFFVYPHSKRISQSSKYLSPQEDWAVWGPSAAQIPTQLWTPVQFHRMQSGGDPLFPASNHLSKCGSYLLDFPPKHSPFSHCRQWACASVANQFLGCLQNSPNVKVAINKGFPRHSRGQVPRKQKAGKQIPTIYLVLYQWSRLGVTLPRLQDTKMDFCCVNSMLPSLSSEPSANGARGWCLL